MSLSVSDDNKSFVWRPGEMSSAGEPHPAGWETQPAWRRRKPRVTAQPRTFARQHPVTWQPPERTHRPGNGSSGLTTRPAHQPSTPAPPGQVSTSGQNTTPPFASPFLDIYPSNFSCDSETAKPLSGGKVYWGVFAGRRDRLKFQEKYWVQLFDLGLITEVHLWDFTNRGKNTTDRKLNKEWIESKAKQHKFVSVLYPKPQSVGSFNAFYEHYAQHTSEQDIVVKVDDDIAFVNVSEFKCFVKFVSETTEAFTVSSNIVNNGVIAHFQQALGSIPFSLGEMEYPSQGKFGTLWKSSSKAYDLHKYFVTHQEDFYKDAVVRYWDRLSINFIAYSGGNKAEEVYSMVQDSSDDEARLSTVANAAGAISVVYMRLVVAHVTFSGQSKPPDRTQEILALYEDFT